MPEFLARGQVKQAQIEAVVIRADGTREELGVVAYWHRNPIKRLVVRLRNGYGKVRFR